MGKRARRRPPSIHAKKHKLEDETHGDLEDRISLLPHEVLVSILSLLTMREAGRTSVLSRQWNKLWTFIYGLNFDGSKTLNDIRLGRKLIENESPRFVSWVNQVVDSYQSLSLDEFRVRFSLDTSSRIDMDRWIYSALEKKVKRLELNLSTCDGATPPDPYTLHGIGMHLRSRHIDFSSSNSLAVLQLKSVNVTGEVLECFLSNFPNLEHLSVNRSDTLVSLKLARPLPRLKYLDISFCFNVESIELFAANLLFLKYMGPWISLRFENFPNLAKISVGCEYGGKVIFDFFHLSTYFSQLETIVLDVFSLLDARPSLKIPCLTKLRWLDLSLLADESILSFTPLIEASPFLHKFTLQLSLPELDFRRKIKKAAKCPHQHLRVVEFVGFVGHAVDLEFFMYLMENTVALERVILDCRDPLDIGTPWEFEETRRKRAARKRAMRLRKEVPSSAELVIL